MTAVPDKSVPAPKPSLVEKMYGELRAAIVNGELEPGYPLKLLELSERYGVSLIPIREALRRLEVERLVESQPNKGAWVARISVDDVEDAYATRLVLEMEAIKRGWHRYSPDTIEELRQIRSAMLEAFGSGNESVGTALHRELHLALYRQAESLWLEHLIEILWSHTERYRRLAWAIRPFPNEREDSHGLVLDAIAADDVEAAIGALKKDLDWTANLVIARYERESANQSAVELSSRERSTA